MTPRNIIALIMLIVFVVVVIYAVIVTAVLVVVRNNCNKQSQSISSMRDELEQKEKIIEKQKAYLNDLANADSISDYIDIWNRLQDDKSNNH